MTEIVKGWVDPATTKKALREAVAADPTQVMFCSLKLFNAGWDGPVSSLPEGTSLSVAGPDPRSPKWWATITRRGERLVVT